MNKYYKIIIIVIVLIVVSLPIFLRQKNSTPINTKSAHFWNVQSIDTVKYSRDPARQYLNDPSFDATIDSQVKAIAGTGANYVAIGTPYDAEFVPFLSRWVAAARRYGLNVWFRGNFSGWEGWFDYPSIDRTQHEQMLKKFILDNGNLFQDGDIFTACTECENGGPGDPRLNGDVTGHRQFLIDEYQISRNAFAQIGKNVATNYFPMNADVAKLVMDPATTQALGGLVVIDHYVPTPDNLNQGVNDLAASSGGHVVLGEFGAPIPDLQGNLTESQQADWVRQALMLLAQNKNLTGINYWTSYGGSTELWNDDGTPRQVVSILRNFFSPNVLKGTVKNDLGQPVSGATIVSPDVTVISDTNGQFFLPFDMASVDANVSADGYIPVGVVSPPIDVPVTAILVRQNENLIYKIQKILYKTFNNI